jgi:hypothetical protein
MRRPQCQKKCKPQQEVQQLAKLKNKNPMNNHKKLELQVQDLNFAKLNQTRTRIMERNNEQGWSTTVGMSGMNKTVLQGICTTNIEELKIS